MAEWIFGRVPPSGQVVVLTSKEGLPIDAEPEMFVDLLV